MRAAPERRTVAYLACLAPAVECCASLVPGYSDVRYDVFPGGCVTYRFVLGSGASPVRIALAGFLALRRRWWHLAAFTAAIVLSEVPIGSLKGSYDRARPPGSLVATTGASFPSGHAIAASVTVAAAVIALVPPGRRRTWWGAAAVAFSIVMGLSRAYLGAHWLSDATAGILLGTSCALVTALITGQLQRRRNREPRPARTRRPAGVPPSRRAGTSR